MLMLGSCSKCGKEIGVVQYSDHYFCEWHSGEYVCVECYQKGQKTCEKCGSALIFHSASGTKRWKTKAI